MLPASLFQRTCKLPLPFKPVSVLSRYVVIHSQQILQSPCYVYLRLSTGGCRYKVFTSGKVSRTQELPLLRLLLLVGA